MKVYTRRGDGGDTDLFGGDRVGKDDAQVAAYGAVDELNSVLGLCHAAVEQTDLRASLERSMGLCFDLGAHLATPSARREKSQAHGPGAEEVERLESEIDALEQELTPLRRFVLPGGCEAAARLHLARTVCRRAERAAVALHRDAAVAATALRFLNRLSDLLFVMARVANHRAGVPDVEWAGLGD